MFLVARIGWCVEPRDDRTCHDLDLMNRAGEDRRFVPVAAFATREAAERRMRELELEAARVFNPFQVFGAPASRQEHDELRSRFAAVTSELPVVSDISELVHRRVWCEWWDEHVSEWSDETLWDVWSLFDQIRFYAVLEIEVGDE